MYSKNTLALNRFKPSVAKTLYKYSRTLISLLQPTTNQIISLAFMIKKQNDLPLVSMIETQCIARITKIIKTEIYALFIHPA